MNRIIRTFCVFAAISIFIAPVPWSTGQVKASGSQEKGVSAKIPSTPAQAYLVMKNQSIEESVKELQSGNKTKNLISGDTIGCRLFIQHEKDVTTNQAEVHDGADDVFIIMEGATTLVLGGALDSPKQVQPGEWRASNITGGKEFKLSKGDMIVVPRGTPHMRVTAAQEVTVMVMKAFAPAGK